jgi:hypothetical protein
VEARARAEVASAAAARADAGHEAPDLEPEVLVQQLRAAGTVAADAYNVFRKLDISSRTQIAGRLGDEARAA